MRFKVTFKEDYIPHETTQSAMYGLDEEDIEWYVITKMD